MRPAAVVEVEIAASRCAGLGHAAVGPEIRLDVELLRQLSQCSIAFDGGKGHLGPLASKPGVWRAVVCSLSLLIRRAQRARCQAETPLIALSRFLRPAL